jgi:hypothetical protein
MFSAYNFCNRGFTGDAHHTYAKACPRVMETIAEKYMALDK